MAHTTIAVESTVKDRIEAAAERRGITAGRFVELLLEAWLREERLTAIRQAMEQATRDAVEPLDPTISDPDLLEPDFSQLGRPT